MSNVPQNKTSRSSHGLRNRPSHQLDSKLKAHSFDDEAANQWAKDGVVDPGGIKPGTVDGDALVPGTVSATPFASTVRPVIIVTALPTLPHVDHPEFSYVVLTTDERLYKNIGGTWVKGVNGADIVADTITAGQIAVGAIGADEIAAGAVTVAKRAWKGVNLLDDSSFEKQPVCGFDTYNTATTDFAPYWNSSNVSTAQYGLSANAKTGSRLLVLRGNGVTTFPSFGGNFVPVQPGRTYRIAGWSYRGATAATARVRLDAFSETFATVATAVAIFDNATTTPTYGYATYTVPTDGSVSYVKVLMFNALTTPAITTTIAFEDIELMEVTNALKNTGATTVIDDAGVTITNGALTVTNAGATVIIDGTSNMFKIAATGTTSRTQAAGSQGSTVVTLSALGNTNTVTPGYLAWIAIGTSSADARSISLTGYLLNATRYVAATSGGAVTTQVVGWRGVFSDYTIISAGEIQYGLTNTNADTGSTTCYSRYYILIEGAL